MSDYLVVDGWNGSQKVPISIINETPDGFEIKAIESVFLPGRGILKEGQSTYILKEAMMIERSGKPETGIAWER